MNLFEQLPFPPREAASVLMLLVWGFVSGWVVMAILLTLAAHARRATAICAIVVGLYLSTRSICWGGVYVSTTCLVGIALLPSGLWPGCYCGACGW